MSDEPQPTQKTQRLPHPDPYPCCIFCGAKADSREHAIPKWMSKQLGIKEHMISRTGNLPRRKQPISFASHRARIFCEGCNGHFKHLEDAVIPLLVPMANNRIISLGADSQAVLALWAAKTAIALVAATPDLRDFVPKPSATPSDTTGFRPLIAGSGTSHGMAEKSQSSWVITP